MSFTTHGFALVTGAGSGIGRATSLSLAQNGVAGILFADLDGESAREAAAQSAVAASNPRYRALYTQVDVTDVASVQAMVDKAKAAFGNITYCINSAGSGRVIPQAAADMPVEQWSSVLDVNLNGTFNVSRAAAQVMRGQDPTVAYQPSGPRPNGRGAIVNISSVYGLRGVPNVGAYVSSKHAVCGLTKTMALEHAAQGIRVNAVCPSWTDTPMMRRTFDEFPDLRQRCLTACPMNRLAMPEEVADTIVFLCSPAASYISGETLVVDGAATVSI